MIQKSMQEDLGFLEVLEVEGFWCWCRVLVFEDEHFTKLVLYSAEQEGEATQVCLRTDTLPQSCVSVILFCRYRIIMISVIDSVLAVHIFDV